MNESISLLGTVLDLLDKVLTFLKPNHSKDVNLHILFGNDLERLKATKDYYESLIFRGAIRVDPPGAHLPEAFFDLVDYHFIEITNDGPGKAYDVIVESNEWTCYFNCVDPDEPPKRKRFSKVSMEGFDLFNCTIKYKRENDLIAKEIKCC